MNILFTVIADGTPFKTGWCFLYLTMGLTCRICSINLQRHQCPSWTAVVVSHAHLHQGLQKVAHLVDKADKAKLKTHNFDDISSNFIIKKSNSINIVFF